MTPVKSDDDSIVSFYAFKFTSCYEIFKVKNEDSYLIDNFLKSWFIYLLYIYLL